MSYLTGKRVAMLLTNGYEDVELISPKDAVTGQGAEVDIIAPKKGTITGKHGHEETATVQSNDARAEDYDALILPGGVQNGDQIRMDEAAVAFTRAFFEQHKPVAAICHGGWILTDAGVLEGRTVTSYPSLRTDLENAGATWVNREVVVDEGLVTSRTPDDLEAFNAKVIEEIAEGKHSQQTV